MKLEVRNGSFSYRKEIPVLRNISFTADQGEVIAILGPNGVGKTTFLKCILGFLDWNEGEVLINGINRKDMKSAQFWQRAAYVPQARTQAFSYKTEEMVVLGRSPYLRLFEMPGKEDEKIAGEAMRMAGVEHLRGKNCNEISGGELQLVLVARALASKPELLIMDEPETGLDFRNQLIVLNLIEKLSRENGITVILNTHYPEHALHVSDKALLLERNGTSLFGKTSDIITEENMQKAFEVNVRIRGIDLDTGRYTCVMPVSLADEEKAYD